MSSLAKTKVQKRRTYPNKFARRIMRKAGILLRNDTFYIRGSHGDAINKFLKFQGFKVN